MFPGLLSFMNTVFRIKIAGSFLAFCLVAFVTLAQVPGSGGPAGMSAAITKLFGDIKSFTAKADVQVLDSSQKEIATVPMDFSLLDKSIRVEMDLTQTKNRNMPPGIADSLKKVGMAHVISIISPAKKSAYVLYPDQKLLLQMSLPKAEADAVDKPPKIEKTAEGKETIDGHPCTKYKVVITDEKGEKLDAFTWNASDLNDFPIQIQTKEKEDTSFIRFSQVKFTSLDPALFEPPADYAQYNNPQDLMQAAMKKALPAAEKKE